MKGSVKKRGKSWCYVVDLPRRADGKRNQKIKSGFRTRKEAEAALATTMTEANKGEYIEPSRMTVKDYLTKWLEDSVKHNNKKSTLVNYKYLLETHVFEEIGEIELGSLQPRHLQQLYSDKLQNGRVDGEGGLSATTVRRIHAVLRKALSTAVKWQLIRLNPADAVDAPKQSRKEMKCLTKEDVETFLEAVQSDTYKVLYLVAIMTGMRRGEILGLRWQDVDLDNGQASIRQSYIALHDGSMHLDTTKTKGSERTVALPNSVVQALRKHKVLQAAHQLKLGPAYKDHDLVFASEMGTPINASNLNRNFKQTLKKAGLPNIRPHDLRHTHATLMLQEGVHPKIVSERLGHSSIQITLDTYSHVLPNLQSEAAQKLDKALFGKSDGTEEVKENHAVYSIRVAN